MDGRSTGRSVSFDFTNLSMYLANLDFWMRVARGGIEARLSCAVRTFRRIEELGYTV